MEYIVKKNGERLNKDFKTLKDAQIGMIQELENEGDYISIYDNDYRYMCIKDVTHFKAKDGLVYLRERLCT